MAQDRALARGVLNHTPGSFTTKMRAVARGVSSGLAGKPTSACPMPNGRTESAFVWPHRVYFFFFFFFGLHQCIRPLKWDVVLRAVMSIRAHPEPATGTTSKGRIGTQQCERARHRSASVAR